MDISSISNVIFQFLGTMASIIGLPYAIFVSGKQTKEKLENTKRVIIDKLAQVIVTNGDLDGVETLSIIRSELRRASISEKKVLGSEILEDLISLISSTPLLETQKKASAVAVLKTILMQFLEIQQGLSLEKSKRKKIFGLFTRRSETSTRGKDTTLGIEKDQPIFDVEAHRRSSRKTFVQTSVMLILSTTLALFAVISLFIFPTRQNDILSFNVNWLVLASGIIGIFAFIYDGIRRVKK